MSIQSKFSPEVRERAVRIVQEQQTKLINKINWLDLFREQLTE